MSSTTQNKAEMAEMLQNKEHLCPAFFDEQDNLLPEVESKLDGIVTFVRENILKSLYKNCEIEDILLYGNGVSYIWNDRSDLDLVFLIKNVLPIDNQLRVFTSTFQHRGFEFKIKDHYVDYCVMPVDSLVVAPYSYSMLKHRWNKKPVRREFLFSINTFYNAYCNYANDFEALVDRMEKNNGFLTVEGCRQLRNYLNHLREEALKTKAIHPHHEYALAYNVFRCFKYFGVWMQYRNYLRDSKCYNLNVREEI